jgi:alkanesulfonate monooxygenase SsuD/methylene tetrahydromethanopterin reductase-like flavin-dependent oxidoreductase (luciferase family)
VRFGVGSVTCQHAPGDLRSDAERYGASLELAVEAERLGLDSVWLSEHHFLPDGYLPSLLVFAAAIAARTERIAIGTDILLAPLHEPIRLAEDATVVDLLSHGRLVLGIAQGWRREEFDGLRVPYRGKHLRFEDTIATLRQAWSDGLTIGGPVIAYPDVPVTPKPAQPGGPPLWVGGASEPAVRRAGRLGNGFMSSWASLEEFRRQVAWVRDEVERAGRDPAGFGWSIVLPLFVWEGPDAWTRARDAFNHYVWSFERLSLDGAPTGHDEPPALTAERDDMLRSLAIVGPPEEVTERLAAYDDVAPGNLHVVAELMWPALDDAVLREAMAILAYRILPAVRAG